MSLRGLAKRGRHGLGTAPTRREKRRPAAYPSPECGVRRGGMYSESPVPPGESNFVGERPLSENARAQGDHRVVARSVQGACETDRARRRRHSRGTYVCQTLGKAEIDERRRKGEPSAADCFSHDDINIVYLKRSAYLDTERARKTHVVHRETRKGNHQKERLQPESLCVCSRRLRPKYS